MMRNFMSMKLKIWRMMRCLIERKSKEWTDFCLISIFVKFYDRICYRSEYSINIVIEISFYS